MISAARNDAEQDITGGAASETGRLCVPGAAPVASQRVRLFSGLSVQLLTAVAACKNPLLLARLICLLCAREDEPGNPQLAAAVAAFEALDGNGQVSFGASIDITNRSYHVLRLIALQLREMVDAVVAFDRYAQILDRLREALGLVLCPRYGVEFMLRAEATLACNSFAILRSSVPDADPDHRCASIMHPTPLLALTDAHASRSRGGMGTGVFLVASMLNHSCEPNCTYTTAADLNGHTLTISALRDIQEGEELFISYTDPSAPCSVRRARLRQYGFECDCTRCCTET